MRQCREQPVTLRTYFFLCAIFFFAPHLHATEGLRQAEAFAVEASAGESASKSEGLVDINSATPEQLKSLVGIGDIYVKRILAGRPYKSTDELVERKILPRITYEKIKNQIVAKPR